MKNLSLAFMAVIFLGGPALAQDDIDRKIEKLRKELGKELKKLDEKRKQIVERAEEEINKLRRARKEREKPKARKRAPKPPRAPKAPGGLDRLMDRFEGLLRRLEERVERLEKRMGGERDEPRRREPPKRRERDDRGGFEWDFEFPDQIPAELQKFLRELERGWGDGQRFRDWMPKKRRSDD